MASDVSTATIIMDSSSSFLPTAMITTGCLTIVLASLLAYTIVLQQRRRNRLSDSKQTNVSSSSIAEKENSVDLSRYPGGEVTVYYATQTGTAESFSQSLEREGAQHGFLVHVVDVEDVMVHITNAQEQQQKLPIAERSIFITATYGEGEAPDGAVAFCQWLQSVAGNIPFLEGKSTSDSQNIEDSVTTQSILSHVEYAVFGLGNTQYEHFNATGKFVDRALFVTGANRILPISLGDDNVDIEADFESWKDQQLWPTLRKRYHVTDLNSNQTDNKKPSNVKRELPKCQLRVVFHESGLVLTPNYDIPLEQIHSSSRHYFTAYECPVRVVRELQSPPTKPLNGDKEIMDSTVHIEIDIGSARPLRNTSDTIHTMSYTTADNLGVLPLNSDDVVERVAERLGYNLDQVISVAPSGTGGDWHGMPFPTPITIRECFLRYLDFTSPPRRSDLKRLSAYCTDSIDEKALLRMSSKEGRQEYKEKVLDRYVGFVDLLQLCPSIQMPLEHLLNYCSPLQTRFFTISSSSSVHPKSVHITVAVTKHQRFDGSIFRGVCSNYLSKQIGSTKYVRIFQRASSFRLPSDTSKPILLIGPGTGIAPMRAILQEREYQRDILNKCIGSNILYFGCKHEAQDFLYRNELETWAKPGGILTHLRVAFSRDHKEKIYVQDLLRQNGDETWRLIRDNDVEGGAYVYVCGGVKMGQDVTEALKEIIALHGNMSAESASDYVKKLSKDGRFVQELWA